jgi:hypothetical protein
VPSGTASTRRARPATPVRGSRAATDVLQWGSTSGRIRGRPP